MMQTRPRSSFTWMLFFSRVQAAKKNKFDLNEVTSAKLEEYEQVSYKVELEK